MASKDRGFASMDSAKRHKISSMGGRAAHKKGTAHEWTREEARKAGHKGGLANHSYRLKQFPAIQVIPPES